jgi:orotate phosphoribosyltransferase
MAALALGRPFVYAERIVKEGAGGLYPVKYRLPRAQHDAVRGRRVAIVNDVVSAGSAVRGALEDLKACGATVVVIGALAVLGPSAAQLAAGEGLALETLSALPYELWAPESCPLCARGVPLTAAP